MHLEKDKAFHYDAMANDRVLPLLMKWLTPSLFNTRNQKPETTKETNNSWCPLINSVLPTMFLNWGAFQLSVIKPKTRVIKRSLRANENSMWHQPNCTKHGKTHVTKSWLFSFASDWLREWREFSRLITGRSKATPIQSQDTLDTQLKNALWCERIISGLLCLWQ